MDRRHTKRNILRNRVRNTDRSTTRAALRRLSRAGQVREDLWKVYLMYREPCTLLERCAEKGVSSQS